MHLFSHLFCAIVKETKVKGFECIVSITLLAPLYVSSYYKFTSNYLKTETESRYRGAGYFPSGSQHVISLFKLFSVVDVTSSRKS